VNAGQPLSIPLARGGALGARVWEGDVTPQRAVVLLGALGARQRYLRHVAADLARRGWGVLSFDWRGTGESRAAGPGGGPINLDVWGEDVHAALGAARQRFGGVRPVALGHSLGGMLLGHSGAGDEVAGLVAVASSLGAPDLYGLGRDRLRLELAYRVLPGLARLRGHLPRFVFGERVPREALAQWVRWGRGGRYVRWDGASSGPWFERLEGPLVAVALRDDGYAPLPAVDAFLAAFPRARGRREVLAPREGEALGHFGLFRPDAPAWAREALCGWLDEVAG
jgi:predicted alpha/beta hydrolase